MAAPGTVRRRRLAPEARRAELVDAAIEVLRMTPPNLVRIEDVTAAAGASKATFYVYFSSWDDLVAAARERVQSDYMAGVRERFAGAVDRDSWWAALRDEVRHFVEYQVELGPLHDALFHGPGHVEPRGASGADAIGVLLDAGRAAGAFRALDTPTVSTLLFQLIHGAADAVRAGADLTRVLAALDDAVWRWLAPEPVPE